MKKNANNNVNNTINTDINPFETLNPLLMSGDSSKYIETLKNLLKKGLDINFQDGDGNTLLHHVMLQNGPWSIVEFLLKKRSDLSLRNHQGYSSLLYFISSYLDWVDESIIISGDPFVMYLAAANKVKIFFNFCIKSGVNFNGCEDLEFPINSNYSNCHGNTLLHLAIASYPPDYVSEVGIAYKIAKIEYLIKSHKLNINARNSRGETALAVAVQSLPISVHTSFKSFTLPFFGLINLLIKNGADLEIPDNQGDTPLCSALHVHHWDYAEHLVECGANMEPPGLKEKTVLQLARQVGYPERHFTYLENLHKMALAKLQLSNRSISALNKLAQKLNKGELNLKSQFFTQHKITNEELTSLMKELEQHTSITRLDLSGNKIDERGAKIIERALLQNTKLTKILLDTNKSINPHTLQHIEELLSRNKLHRLVIQTAFIILRYARVLFLLSPEKSNLKIFPQELKNYVLSILDDKELLTDRQILKIAAYALKRPVSGKSKTAFLSETECEQAALYVNNANITFFGRKGQYVLQNVSQLIEDSDRATKNIKSKK